MEYKIILGEVKNTWYWEIRDKKTNKLMTDGFQETLDQCFLESKQIFGMDFWRKRSWNKS